MTLSKMSRLALPLLVGAAGVYAAIYAVIGADWSKMDRSELLRVEGCYNVGGQRLLKVSGRTIFTPDMTIGFEGRHEKGRDVLLLDSPVQLARGPQFALVREGTLTKVPIIYDEPIRLQFWDENSRRWEASRADCKR